MNKINRVMIILEIGKNNYFLQLKVSWLQSSRKWSYFTENILIQLTLACPIIFKLIITWKFSVGILINDQ